MAILRTMSRRSGFRRPRTSSVGRRIMVGGISSCESEPAVVAVGGFTERIQRRGGHGEGSRMASPPFSYAVRWKASSVVLRSWIVIDHCVVVFFRQSLPDTDSHPDKAQFDGGSIHRPRVCSSRPSQF